MTRALAIAAGLAGVRARIAAALAAAGRPPDSARLVAVSKKMPADDVRAALDAGQRDFGESYAQELRDKRALLEARPGVAPATWHYIGPLQSNKVKYVAGKAALIHAPGGLDILREIDRRTPPRSVQDCLIQVNVAGEVQKSGLAPAELPALLDAFAALARVRCRGLMLIPPRGATPEDSRPHFAALRRLRDAEAARSRPHVELVELSMGMSDDLEIAIAEGATLVRVGTAIFGSRT